MCGGFRPPTDETGRVLSYEEYCERSGCPFNDEQRSTRQALHDYIRDHADERRDHHEYVGGLNRAEPCGALRSIFTVRETELMKAVEDADFKRRKELRAQGWEWPHRRKK